MSIVLNSAAKLLQFFQIRKKILYFFSISAILSVLDFKIFTGTQRLTIWQSF